MESELPPLGSPERRKALRRARYLRNKEKAREQAKAWYQANKERSLRISGEYNLRNREKQAAMAREHYRKNRKYYIEKALRRYSTLKDAKPSWLSQKQEDEILALYDLAAELTGSTGIKHEVDHIEPLQGEFSCGLHVPWNLQVLTKEENRKKSNKLAQ